MSNDVLENLTFKHREIAVGGTFDVLHAGHKKLLERAFELGQVVFIGVSGDRLVSGLDKDHRVKSFYARRSNLIGFLKSKGWFRRARIVELKDWFGPATRRRNIGALVVSQESRYRGRLVNSLREKNGLPPIRLYVVRLVMAEDGLPISVTRIKRGEIDLEGKLARQRKTRLG